MSSEQKPTVDKQQTFDKLEIRLGRVLEARPELDAAKKSYRLKVDFGKFGVRTSVGRFTSQPPEALIGKQVLGALNFEPRQIGSTVSEVLILGVQVPQAESGEAMIITPIAEAKIGGKLF